MFVVAPPTPTPLDEQRFAVVDVETSGLSWRRHRIIEIAVVTVLGDGRVVDRWSTLVRPRFARVGPTHIHGLTAADVRRAPGFAAVVPELVRRLDGTVFTAHNAAFDWGFVQRALRRAGYPVPGAARLCTRRLSRRAAPDAPSHRLVDVCDRHGVELRRAHDALADAEATAAVLPHLLRAADVATPEALAAAVLGTGTTWPAAPRATRARRLVAWLRR
jgi:DNA polymerase-3 subunit epsilon